MCIDLKVDVKFVSSSHSLVCSHQRCLQATVAFARGIYHIKTASDMIRGLYYLTGLIEDEVCV